MTTEVIRSGNNPTVTGWNRTLPYWSVLFMIAYSGLVIGAISVLMPASQNSSLPEKFFELIAAGSEPVFYPLIILCDVLAWIALGGLFLTFSGLLETLSPFRSKFIFLLAAGQTIGFFGACLRLAGTPQLAGLYLTASGIDQTSIVQSYSLLLMVINITFSAGGVFQGLSMLLVAFSKQSFSFMPGWSAFLIGLSGTALTVKGLLELCLRMDMGPIGLLAGVLLIIALIGILIRMRIES